MGLNAPNSLQLQLEETIISFFAIWPAIILYPLSLSFLVMFGGRAFFNHSPSLVVFMTWFKFHLLAGLSLKMSRALSLVSYCPYLLLYFPCIIHLIWDLVPFILWSSLLVVNHAGILPNHFGSQWPFILAEWFLIWILMLCVEFNEWCLDAYPQATHKCVK